MGGHFDVDDAAVLAPGRCQIELWAVRGDISARSDSAETVFSVRLPRRH
jgi:hypothetical protein